MAHSHSITKRLDRLEQATRATAKGFRNLYTSDIQPGQFVERGPATDRRAFMHPNPDTGEWPPGCVFHSREDVARMQREGWRVWIVNWTALHAPVE
jgi:hypothetical protein